MIDSPTSAHTVTMQSYTNERCSHWNTIASKPTGQSIFSKHYHRHLEWTYKFLVPPGLKVLELGCGKGELLASLKPAYGVGIDFSPAMVAAAKERFPDLSFQCADVHTIENLDESFDVIILSDLINDLWDIQTVFTSLRGLCNSKTRVIVNFYSRMWQLPLEMGKVFGFSRPTLPQNWLTREDVENLFHLAGFETVRHWEEFLFPFAFPLIEPLFNHFLIRLWPFNLLACANFLIARPSLQPEKKQPSVSVLVPARNEAGNISSIFSSVPNMGKWTELIFVEGGSKDQTYEAIEREIAANPERRCKLLKQIGTGKGQAVRQGFAFAEGDILMILDADLTVPPDYLPRFYEAIANGKGEFINGVRLVYPMEKEAMRFLNFLGNKFFSLAFSWLLGQPIKDTLCGTKVLWKSDYERIVANRAYFGDFDPFGDFDLIFGAAKLNLKLIDLPIRYKERVYGQTNISRWKHGWLLLKMVSFAAGKIKFV